MRTLDLSKLNTLELGPWTLNLIDLEPGSKIFVES